jgi:hypothetical protein
MILNKRRKWALLAGATGAAAAQLTQHLLVSSWRAGTHKDPPSDPAYDDVDWSSAVLWTIAAGATAALTRLVARHGATVVWKRFTGTKPPRPRRRKRIHSRREAFV